MPTPLVSIVIPSYNYAPFLAAAIESALAQTYPERELIVIDDGSTDDSVEVASAYGDRIRLLTQENQGVVRTCNRGVAEASGEYVTFLAADDEFAPTYVEELLAALGRRPEASFAYSAAKLFGAETRTAPARPFSPFWLTRRLNYINGSALTRRADYLEVGGYREEMEEVGLEDWDFWLSMVEHGKRGTYVAKPLLRWRRHPRGSRNPDAAPATFKRQAEQVRRRHAALRRSLRSPGATFWCALDVAVWPFDRILWLSRSRRLLRWYEELLWRRFLRYYEPAGGAD